MNTKVSLLFFGIPALGMLLVFYLVLPWLEKLNLTPFERLVLIITVPMAMLFASAIILYKLENKNGDLGGFLDYFRLKKIQLADVRWGLGLFGFMVISYGLFSYLGTMLVNAGWIPAQGAVLSFLDPRESNPEDLQAQHSILKVALLYSIMLFFNIFGEELWWRGYVLPRQEKHFGKYAWIIHGLLWTLFHAFKWWDLIGLFPVCLSLSYVAQKRQSTWPGIIAHLLFNGLGFIGLMVIMLGS